jgi:ketosteroid isomerase-like protein
VATARTDMDRIAARYRALLEPAGPGRDVAYARDAHVRAHAPDAHAFLPGTWFMAGHHHGGESVGRMWEAVRVIWPQGTRLVRTHLFVGEDTIAIEWWSRNRVWNGNECSNSGVGRLRFRGEAVVDHHEITDSEYFEEVHGDWRRHLGPALGHHLPRWHDTRPPFYPDPARNDWALEHSPSDGRAQAPAAVRGRLETAIGWWGASRADDALFTDDVDVFFQGRLWPLGGHHRGRAALERVRAVERRLWPGRARIVQANFWADESRVLIEWFREARTWRGQDFREGGFTVWEWRGDRVAATRTYVDTSLHAELLCGWRDVVGASLGATLPNWTEPPRPRYPRPDEHE